MTNNKIVNFNNKGAGNYYQAAENIYINKPMNVEDSDAIKSVLIELTDLLSSSLKDKEQEIEVAKNQLIEQSAQPKEKRDNSIIKTVLGTVSGYIGMLSIAVEKAEDIKRLFEQVKVFFGI